MPNIELHGYGPRLEEVKGLIREAVKTNAPELAKDAIFSPFDSASGPPEMMLTQEPAPYVRIGSTNEADHDILVAIIEELNLEVETQPIRSYHPAKE